MTDEIFAQVPHQLLIEKQAVTKVTDRLERSFYRLMMVFGCELGTIAAMMYDRVIAKEFVLAYLAVFTIESVRLGSLVAQYFAKVLAVMDQVYSIQPIDETTLTEDLPITITKTVTTYTLGKPENGLQPVADSVDQEAILGDSSPWAVL